MQYGLIGEKLSHSFSKEVHSKLADYEYVIRELSWEELPEFMQKREFTAINVTIPYKEAVIPYLHYISNEQIRLYQSYLFQTYTYNQPRRNLRRQPR